MQDLIQGTRAVGKGDFGTRLPLPSRDEMGFLVQSFNDMTKRLRRASEEADRSRQLIEHERERLAVILARLSTGVLVVDTRCGCASPTMRPTPSSAPSSASTHRRGAGALAEAPPRLRQFPHELQARRLAARGARMAG